MGAIQNFVLLPLSCLIIFAASTPTYPDARKALVILYGPTARGQLLLSQTGPNDTVRVLGKVWGLKPGRHGFHVHQFGNVSAPDCSGVGVHYNPLNFSHAGPQDAERHEGDLGNIQANKDGIATINTNDHVITLFGKYSILGRSFVAHAKEDDLGRGNNSDSKLTGNAGAKLACGIIGLVAGS